MVDSEEHITVPRDLRTGGQDTVSWLGLQGASWPLWVPPLPGFLDLGGSCSECRRPFFPACRGPSHQQMITLRVISRCGNARDQRGGDIRGNGGKFVLGLYRNTKLEDVSLALSFPITSRIQQTGRKGASGETSGGTRTPGQPAPPLLGPSRGVFWKPKFPAGEGCAGAPEKFCSRPSRHHFLELHGLERGRPGEDLKSRIEIFEIIVFSHLWGKLILRIQPLTGNRFLVSVHPGYVCTSLFSRNCFVNCAFSTYCIMNTAYQKYPSAKMTLNGHVKCH